MSRRFSHLLIALVFLCLPSLALAKGVVLNFTDVDIATMVKFISDLTGKNFVMDERVKGKISIFSPTKLTSEEAFNLFTSVLELKGFTLVPTGKAYKIVPTAQARQSGMKVLGEAEKGVVNESYVARVIPLENITAQDAVSFLQPMVSKDGHLSSFGPGNLLLVVDSALNIQKILSLLQLIDTDQPRAGAELIFLKNANAENVAGVIRDWLGSKAPKPTGKGDQAGASPLGTVVVGDSRLNALIVFGSEKRQEIAGEVVVSRSSS